MHSPCLLRASLRCLDVWRASHSTLNSHSRVVQHKAPHCATAAMLMCTQHVLTVVNCAYPAGTSWCWGAVR